MNPGAGSSQSANVRTRTLRRTPAEGDARRRPFPACPLTSRNARSIVAALIASRPPRTHPPPGPRARLPAGRPTAEQPYRVLAVQTRHRRELVQDAAPVLPAGPAVTLRYRPYQLVTRCHADPPHACLRRTPAGSILGEATGHHSGAFQVRQCVVINDCRGRAERAGGDATAFSDRPAGVDIVPAGAAPAGRDPLDRAAAASATPRRCSKGRSTGNVNSAPAVTRL